MIERVVIKNYKCIKNANIAFNKFKNIIVGNNGVGKSTLMEAVSLALGYGLNKFEVTPHIFNIESIQEYKPEFGIRLSQKVNYVTRHDSSSLHIGECLSMFCKKRKDSLIG